MSTTTYVGFKTGAVNNWEEVINSPKIIFEQAKHKRDAGKSQGYTRKALAFPLNDMN
jgi:hypothetical protein